MVIQRWIRQGAFSILSSLLAITCLSNALSTPASAETKQFNFILSSCCNQSFAEFIEQAESLASESINRAFAENSQMTAVSVKVVGERNGQEAQVISATVSRSNWQKQPKIQLWTQYLRNAGLLLGFIQLQQPRPIVTKQPNAVEKEQLAATTHQEPNFFD